MYERGDKVVLFRPGGEAKRGEIKEVLKYDPETTEITLRNGWSFVLSESPLKVRKHFKYTLRTEAGEMELPDHWVIFREDTRPEDVNDHMGEWVEFGPSQAAFHDDQGLQQLMLFW